MLVINSHPPRITCRTLCLHCPINDLILSYLMSFDMFPCVHCTCSITFSVVYDYMHVSQEYYLLEKDLKMNTNAFKVQSIITEIIKMCM